jgi:hypothetical protein
MNDLKARKIYKMIGIQDKDKILSRLSVEDKKTALRQLRQTECFSFVDRPIWYNKLTDNQKKEVNEWYEQWLKVTDTFVVPEKPTFVR